MLPQLQFTNKSTRAFNLMLPYCKVVHIPYRRRLHFPAKLKPLPIRNALMLCVSVRGFGFLEDLLFIAGYIFANLIYLF